MGLQRVVGNAVKWVPQKVASFGNGLLQKMQMFDPTHFEIVTGAGNEPAKPLLTSMVAEEGFLKPAAANSANGESFLDPGLAAKLCSVALPSEGLDESFGASLARDIQPGNTVGITPAWEETKVGWSKDQFVESPGFISGS